MSFGWGFDFSLLHSKFMVLDGLHAFLLSETSKSAHLSFSAVGDSFRSGSCLAVRG